MELMGFEYLSLDQDRVALNIAKQYNVDWSATKASSLPAVAEDPLQGVPLG